MNINYSIKKIRRHRELQREKSRRIKSFVALFAVLFIGIFIGNFFNGDFGFSPSLTGLVTGNLPDVGESNWGTILNNYLLQEHTTNGTHGNVTAESINSTDWTNVSITESQISDLHVWNATNSSYMTFGDWNATNSSYRTLDNLTFEGNVNVTGNLTVNGGINTSNVILKTKVIEIGDWNMDTTFTVNVAHGLTQAKIRSVTGLIYFDTGTAMVFPGNQQSSTDGLMSAWISSIDSTNIVLFRLTGGRLDSTDFDATSFNRGWLTIIYEA